MRIPALLIALALTAALAASSATAQQYQLQAPTISASPGLPVFSTPVTISGRARGRGRETILLQTSTVRTGTFATIQRGTTERNGRYRFGHRPARNTYYKVVMEAQPSVASPPLLVRVRMLVGLRLSDATPAAGARVRFSGIVRPAHNGRRAYVQRRSPAGRWVTVGRTTLRALDAQTSRYSLRLRVRRSGVYRARVLGHADHAMGISRERTATVQ